MVQSDKLVLALIFAIVIVGSVYAQDRLTKIVTLDQPEDYFVEVARGNVQGASSVNKFGANYDVGTSDEVIWDRGGDYNWITTATQINVSSSDVNDANGSTGAWDIVVEGLDENWELYSETLTLNGQTPVQSTGQFMRVFRAYNVHSGSSAYNEGTLYISTGAVVSGVPSDSTQIYAQIRPEHGQTLMTVYTVPANKNAYILQGYITSDGQKPVSAHFYNRLNNGGNPVRTSKFDFDFNNYFIFEYQIPFGTIPPKTDLWVEAKTSTGTSKISAGFDLLLIDQ